MSTNNKLLKKFSFPINFNVMQEDVVYWKQWFKTHSEYINEVYLTPAHMGMRFEDMNGRFEDVDSGLINDLIESISESGINICIVLNNIFEITDSDIGEFEAILDTNKFIVDYVVVPSKSWIKPMKNRGLIVKNTVLNLPTHDNFNEYKDYDVIYIHDEIIHNHNIYMEKKKGHKLGTVVNFSDCSTFCKHKRSHYKLLSKNLYEENSSFCITKKYTNTELLLKRNNIPGYISEYNYYSDIIDVYKLQGRSNTGTFKTAKSIIENIYNGSSFLTEEYKNLTNKILPKTLDAWMKYKRNCGGDCVNCDFCDNIIKESLL